ncbi:histone deacetylase hosB [Aspergillus mulundensis]|uniref:Putative HOS3-like histone deacetylase n=1 Tax=Aspergillus mulundensis TaxID=1810919 RepID=A0A3D8QZD1_9EURO|nr:putative HOS3-like histone deacetylase [Aspergillus mulundensis]RDW67139.1 putative HOS3-like histone deacetylase [Aspergillus mulundensis]
MDPSNPAGPAPIETPPAPPIDPSIFSERLSDTLTATTFPTSPSAFSSSSLLSPSDLPAHPASQAIPRRDQSTSTLNKRSSTDSLRSTQLGGPSSSRPSMSRRASSTFATSLNANGITTSSIAAEHFKKEVEHHQSADLQSQTLVVIHDACYGHRFSRPRTPRAALSSIVERPERIQACVVGISAAFVRLAQRHAGGSSAPHPDLDLQQLPVPPFQIRKTTRTLPLNSTAVTNVHGTKWMEDLRTMCDAAESRLAVNGKELVRPRSTGKDDTSGAPAPAFHEGDLYLCSESLNAFEGALGGVCEGIDAVFGPGPTKRAFVAIRPPGHHCSSDHPSGFCWINNVHVGISYAAMTHDLTHAAILDFDLHHGDGGQNITWEQNRKALAAPKNAGAHKKAMIGYFSLHDINSYPCEMGEADKVRNASVCIDRAHGQSIWNVHLEPWNTEQDFWDLYSAKYTVLLDKARAFLKMHTERLASAPTGPAPKAAIFLSAGFDASEWESAGMQRHKVNVPTEFYARFTADVVRMAEEEGLGVDGRCISVLEGGYSNRALISGALSHLSGLSDTQSAQLTGDNSIDRLATEMTDRLGLADNVPTEMPVYHAAYDQEWWSPPLLEELEALVYPALSPSKPKEKSAPTYFAPTQSFTAKVVLPSRDRKSTGSHASLELEQPPLPPVDWAVAAHELSKVLIPSDRQTGSCRPEELNEKASRLRRERHAGSTGARDAAGTPTKPVAGEEKMQLRVRKPKVSAPSTPRPETPARRTIKNSRRTTLDSPSVTSEPSKSPGPRTSRRKSANSTTASTSSATEQDLPPPRPLSQGSVTIRKTAASKAAASRSTTPKRAASQKKPPAVPRVPSTFLSATTPEEHSIASQATSDASERVLDDMDQLASNVQKLSIKLKLPSPEENASREMKAAEDRKRRAPKGPSKAPRSLKKAAARNQPSNTDSKTTPQLPVSTSQDDTPLPDVPRQPSTLATETESVTERLTSDSFVTPVASLPTASTTPVIETTKPIPVDEEHRPLQELFLGRTTSSQSSNANAGISPPLTPGPASNATSPPSMLFSPPASVSVTKHGLPGLTSSGPIPFAPSEASSPLTVSNTEPN